LAASGVGVFSCSVFPDEATLPGAAGAASAPAGAAGVAVGGSSEVPAGGVGGEGVEPTPVAGAGGAQGGAPTVGGAGGAPPQGMGGRADELGGAAGEAGAPACASSQELVGEVTADTWIEAADPDATSHGDDETLSVVGGGQERRALLQVSLPAVPSGAVLVHAKLFLHLQSNADTSRVARQLRVHLLTHEVLEGRASWSHFGNGNRTWAVKGGDFGATLDKESLKAGTAEGVIKLNITEAVAQALAAQVTSLPLIVLEEGSPPPAPADLAFTSREGDASGMPALILEYCEP